MEFEIKNTQVDEFGNLLVDVNSDFAEMERFVYPTEFLEGNKLIDNLNEVMLRRIEHKDKLKTLDLDTPSKLQNKLNNLKKKVEVKNTKKEPIIAQDLQIKEEVKVNEQ